MPNLLHACLTTAIALTLLAGCTAPRSIITSGKVTPVGEIRGGTNLIFNIPTATISSLADVGADAVNQIGNQDTVGYFQNEQVVNNLQRGALAYALDPIGSTQDLYLRYGVARRFDVGARVAAGGLVLDAQYQFLGSTADWRVSKASTTNASIGLIFSTQSADLPGRRALNTGGKLLDFAARRTDLLVPITISMPLGAEEEFGHLATGFVVGRSFLHYQFEPTNLFRERAGTRVAEKIPGINGRQSFMTWGLFVNGKFGYRYVYVLPALTVYYQNYGQLALLNGRSTSLKGTTVVPSIGLQITIPTKRGR